jgi:hypothetical protein
MNRHLIASVAAGIVAAGSLVLFSACASSPTAGATVASMDTFGVEMVKVKDAIDHTLKSLDAVIATQPGDIRTNFDAYAKSVSALDQQANVVRDRAEEMRTMGDEFFKEWEAPESMSPERRTQLTSAYAKIKEDTTLAKDEFNPFLKSLKDVEAYLKLDLSPHGITSMSDTAKKAKDDGAKVKASIDAALVQVNSVRGMVPAK